MNKTNDRKIQIQTIMLNDKPLHGLSGRYQLELSQLEATWIKVTSVGNENLYFEFADDSGTIQNGYCKCL